MKEDFRAFLLGLAGVADFVGGRVHWRRRPQGGALPAVVLQIVSAPRSYNMKGESGLRRTQVQVDLIADSYTQVTVLERLVLPQVSGARVVEGQTEFRGIFVDATREDDEETETGSLFRASIDLTINHREMV